MELIIGNLCSLLAMGTDSLSATQKTAKRVLLVQCLSQLFYGIGNIVLKGYSGTVQNAVSILRNFVAIYKIESKFMEWFLLILGVVLGIAFNNLGLVGYLPIAANLIYTLAVFRFKDDERSLKLVFMVTIVMFIIFNFAILNVVGGITNSVVLVSMIIWLVKDLKK